MKSDTNPRIEFPQEIAERLVQAVIREAREIARERAQEQKP